MTDIRRIGPTDSTRFECLEAMDRQKLSRNAAAKRIGVSSATLSQWLSDKYSGDVPAVEAKVARWLQTEREAERLGLEAAGLDIHRDLGVTDEVAATLAHAQAVGDVVLIHGCSGAGKTWAARHYCRTHSSAYYVSMTCAVRSDLGMLGRVARAVGGHALYRSALEAETAVIERLQDRGALLVVDEAHHLSGRLLDELRCIRDEAGCGLALVGNDAVRMTLARCPQIVGRIASRLAKKSVGEGDVATLVSGVLKRRATAREVKIAHRVAAGPGGLHALRRMLERAWMAARIAGQDGIGIEDMEGASADAAADEEKAA